jgi:hypothetical protein
MVRQFPIGSHVLADFGDGYRIAHVCVGSHVLAGGEIKYPIQAPDGSVHELSHREADDVDAAGSGLTFKTVKA